MAARDPLAEGTEAALEQGRAPWLRPATPTDWPDVEAVLLACGLPTIGAREHLTGFLVAERPGGLVGTAGLELHGESALLRSVAVRPEARGDGLGARLVEGSLALARARGAATVVLLTLDAADYFTRFGFARVATDQVPEAVTASTQFQGVCPASAIAMHLRLA